MEGTPRLVLVQQFAVAITVVGAMVVFSTGLASPFILPKAVVVVAGAGIAVVAAAAHAVARGRLGFRWNVATGAMLVLAAAFCLATLTSPFPVLSVLGEGTRRMGLVSYLAYTAIFLVTVHAYDRRGIELLAGLVSLSVLVVAGYAAVQELGLDPIAWDIDGVHSTLGNPNYVAAFLGAVAPIVLWCLITTREPAQRLLHAISFVALIAALAFARSVQGPVVLGGALAVFAAGWLSLRPRRVRVPGLAALAVTASVSVGALVAGLVGAGPLGFLADRPTTLSRRYHWETALAMWRDEPLLGVGLDLFHAYALAYRPVALLELVGPNRISASPFNVPLDMLASGGVVLGGAYLLFVAVIGVTLLRGLMSSHGGERLLLSALGGAWLGYHIQSLVSIDVPPLAVLHFALAGAIVVLASRSQAGEVDRGSPTTASAPPERVALVVTSVAGLAIVAAALVPLRADAAAWASRDIGGGPEAAIAHADRAVRWFPWDVRHREERAGLLSDFGEPDEAAAEWRALLDLHPRSHRGHLGLARLAKDEGDDELAGRHYHRVLEIDPLRPSIRREVARFERGRDRPEVAVSILERAVEVFPSDPDTWLLLGRTHADLGDTSAARAAFERAMEFGDDGMGARVRRYLDDLDGEGS